MKTLRAMLACGSLYNAFTCLEEAGLGAGCGLNLPSIDLTLPCPDTRLGLCLSVVSGHTVLQCFLVISLTDSLGLGIIFKCTYANLNSETTPSPDTGQRVGATPQPWSWPLSFPTTGQDPAGALPPQR